MRYLAGSNTSSLVFRVGRGGRTSWAGINFSCLALGKSVPANLLCFIRARLGGIYCPHPPYKARLPPAPPRYRRHRYKRVEIAYNPPRVFEFRAALNRIDVSRDIKKKKNCRFQFRIYTILPSFRRMEIFSDGKKVFRIKKKLHSKLQTKRNTATDLSNHFIFIFHQNSKYYRKIYNVNI